MVGKTMTDQDFAKIFLDQEDLETLKSWVEHNTVTECKPSQALLDSGLVIKHKNTEPDRMGGYKVLSKWYTVAPHAAKYLAWYKKKQTAEKWQSVKLNVSFVISVVGAAITIYNFISSVLSK